MSWDRQSLDGGRPLFKEWLNTVGGSEFGKVIPSTEAHEGVSTVIKLIIIFKIPNQKHVLT